MRSSRAILTFALFAQSAYIILRAARVILLLFYNFFDFQLGNYAHCVWFIFLHICNYNYFPTIPNNEQSFQSNFLSISLLYLVVAEIFFRVVNSVFICVVVYDCEIWIRNYSSSSLNSFAVFPLILFDGL